MKSKNTELHEIEVRREKIHKTWNDYVQIQSVIELMERIDLNEQDKNCEEMEAAFFEALAAAKNLMDTVQTKENETNVVVHRNIEMNKIERKWGAINYNDESRNVQTSV